MENKKYDWLNLKKIIELICIILISFLILDYFNIPSILITKYSIYGISMIVLIVLFVILNKKILGLFELNIYNYFDNISISFCCSLLIYQVFSKYVSNTFFKQSILCIIFLLIECIIYARLIFIYITERKREKENINVYDLQLLYNGEINKIAKKELIFLDEKAVDYDLLNRGHSIRMLYDSIRYCKNEKSFVISLTGEWGTGKTTIINIVKDKLIKNNLSEEQYIIIDDFDVWKYNNEKSLFFGMFDEILSRTKIKFSFTEIRRFINICTNIITSNTNADMNFFSSEKEIIYTIKDMIKKYLVNNNKRIVFIIDNLERTNATNILVVLRTICTILNLDRTIFVLSYDEEEMKEIFKNKLEINYDYIEKVVQLPISIHYINEKDIHRICTICMKNLLRYYEVSEKDIRNCESAIQLFISRIKNLRVFKRMVNSIFNDNFYTNNYLNVVDSFLLELIREENIELYRSIRENYKRYVSTDQPTVYGLFLEDAKKYNKETTEYFENLFANSINNEYKDILEYLFPNVHEFFHSSKNGRGYIEFWSESPRYVLKDKDEYVQSNLGRRIYNAKFFDLYFTKGENLFIEIDTKVRDLVTFLNKKTYNMENTDEFNEMQHQIYNLINIKDDEGQKHVFETLEFHIKEIKNNKLSLLLFLWGIRDIINDTMIFLGINASDRLEIVCKEIIKELSEEELSEVRKLIEIDYRGMYFIKGILNWLNPEGRYENDEVLYNNLKESYEKLLENTKENQINLYDNTYYSQYNIHCLIDNGSHKEQMKNVNSNNVFWFLSDIISKSYGTNGYGYSIGKENLEQFMSEEELDSIMQNVNMDDLNEKEKFILEVYSKFKEKNTDIRDKAVYTNEYIDLRNINDKN